MSDLWYWNKERFISLIIVCAYLVIALFFIKFSLIATWISILLYLGLALLCIWFPEGMGSLEYPSGPEWVRQGLSRCLRPTPCFFVRIGGWVLLLLPIVMGVVNFLTNI